jgi:hypothetical protein
MKTRTWMSQLTLGAETKGKDKYDKDKEKHFILPRHLGRRLMLQQGDTDTSVGGL